MNKETITRPLWEQIQEQIEIETMAPPVGSIFGPQDYARGLDAVISYLTDKWRSGYDTSTAVHLLKRERMIATGEINNLIG